MTTMNRHRLSGITAFLLAMNVALGAFGAHLLREMLDEAAMEVYKTATFYGFVHLLGMLIIPRFKGGFTPQAILRVWRLMLIGFFLFCGSLWTLSICKAFGIEANFLGMITPLGGLSWIIAWLLLASLLLRKS